MQTANNVITSCLFVVFPNVFLLLHSSFSFSYGKIVVVNLIGYMLCVCMGGCMGGRCVHNTCLAWPLTKLSAKGKNQQKEHSYSMTIMLKGCQKNQ